MFLTMQVSSAEIIIIINIIF